MGLAIYSMITNVTFLLSPCKGEPGSRGEPGLQGTAGPRVSYTFVTVPLTILHTTVHI